MVTIRGFIALAFASFVLGCDQPNRGRPHDTQQPAPLAQSGPQEDYGQARRAFRTNLIRKMKSPQPWKPVKVPSSVTQVEYPSGELRLKAWVNQPKEGESRPAVLFLHGGWAFDLDDWEMSEPFRKAGYVVLTPLLRGENGQPGHFSMFYDEVDDVLAAADFLAKLPGVDSTHIYLSGHSAGGTLTMLTAMTSDRFRAAAALSGCPDIRAFVESGYQNEAPFDLSDPREFLMRSAESFAGSFKCPARLHCGSKELFFINSSRTTAQAARTHGLD